MKPFTLAAHPPTSLLAAKTLKVTHVEVGDRILAIMRWSDGTANVSILKADTGVILASIDMSVDDLIEAVQ